MRIGDPLTLTREPNNRHDKLAVRVDWQGRQIGYLPRSANQVVAGALDDGERLIARIRQIRNHPDPWQRLELEVLIVL